MLDILDHTTWLVRCALSVKIKSFMVSSTFNIKNLFDSFFFSEPEPAIIDYVTQQYKLFPNIATCFAFQYAATWLWDTYNNVTGELETGNLGNLPEVRRWHVVRLLISE